MAPVAPVSEVSFEAISEAVLTNEAEQSVNTSQGTIEELMEEEDMSDDDLLRVSQKRKITEPVKKNRKTKRTSGKMCAESESDFSLIQEDSPSYSPADIKTFLEQTKGCRLPNVGDFFPDLRLFIKSARPLTRKNAGEEVLTEQEVYRLRKLVVKVKAQIINEEDDF